MKSSLFLILFLSSILFSSCSKKAEISVFNNSEVDRVNEMVELCLCQLQNFDPTSIVVSDADGKIIPSQILYKGAVEPQALLFPVTLKAGVQAIFIVKEGAPVKITSKTNVRFLTEQKDDAFWKNDKIGFSIFGPASADKNSSNGIGGLCLYTKDSLWTASRFDRYKILDNGPLRSSFVLYYDSLHYGPKKLKAELMISLDAGSNFNEAVVMYTGDTTQIRLAAGIVLHDSIQSIVGGAAQGYLGYAEDVYTQDLKRVSSGRYYTGVIFHHPVVEKKQVKGHLVGISKYKIGEEFRYYFGAGWSRHGFKKDLDWFRYLSDKQIALQQPLKVKIVK